MRAAVLTLSMIVSASTAQSAQDVLDNWTFCSRDEECVAVQGVCNPAAVRVEYAQQAESYFRERVKKENIRCTKQFWQPPLEKAQAKCWMEHCQIVGKD